MPVIFYRIPSKSLTYTRREKALECRAEKGRMLHGVWRPFFNLNLPYQEVMGIEFRIISQVCLSLY